MTDTTPPPTTSHDAIAAEIFDQIKAFMDATNLDAQRFGARQWLGCEELGVRIYVRIGPRYLGEVLGPRFVLTLSNIAVRPDLQDQGVFSALLNALKEDVVHRGYGLYVESIVTKRFAKFLTRQGFKEREHLESDQFWLPAEP